MPNIVSTSEKPQDVSRSDRCPRRAPVRQDVLEGMVEAGLVDAGAGADLGGVGEGAPAAGGVGRWEVGVVGGVGHGAVSGGGEVEQREGDGEAKEGAAGEAGGRGSGVGLEIGSGVGAVGLACLDQGGDFADGIFNHARRCADWRGRCLLRRGERCIQ